MGLPGQRRCWPPGAFTPKPAVAGLNLALSWAPTAAAPWSRMTTAPTGQVAWARDANRFRIEELFKDCKNTGCGVALTGLRHADPLARRLLALALVDTGRLRWGAYVIATGQPKLVDKVRNPPLRVFQTGRRFVMRLWQRGQLVQFHWHLAMLPGADH